MKAKILIIIMFGMCITSVGIYFAMSSYLDSYGKNVFCREDVMLTSFGKCRPGGPISIMDEHRNSRLVITVGEPIDYSGLAPITTTQIITSDKPLTTIIDRTYHPTNYGNRQPDHLGTSWELMPGPFRIDMSVVDHNNIDAIDRSDDSSFARIQPLYTTLVTCDDNRVFEILYGAPVTVPIKDDIRTIYDTNLVDGLLPNENDLYVLSFASFFEQEIQLPSTAVVQSHTSEICHTDIQNRETAYYDRIVFEMENKIQDYVPEIIFTAP